MKIYISKLHIGKTDDKSKDERLSNFICGYFLFSALNLAVKTIWGNFAAWAYISKGVLAILLLFALTSVYSRKMVLFVFSEFAVAILFGITLLRGTQNEQFFSIVFNALTVYLPMGLCVFSLNSVDILLKKLYRFSFLTNALLLFVALSFQTTTNSTYSMSVGYGLLFQCLILFDHFFEKRKVLDILFVIIDFITICLYGSRGPILCIAVYTAIKIFISGNVSIKKRIAITFSAVFLILIFPTVLANLISRMPSVFDTSRTLSFLRTGTLVSHDSGRLQIYALYIEQIKQRPWVGYGLVGGWQYSSYPHNIVIELMLSFGIPMGLILFVYIAFVEIRSLLHGSKADRSLSSILFVTLIELFVSDSFMMSTHFFMMLAMGIRSKRCTLQEQCRG